MTSGKESQFRRDEATIATEGPRTHDDWQIRFSDLDPIDQEAGEHWAEAQYLRWLDAVIWAGARNAEASATLAGFRAFQRRKQEDRELSDGAVEFVGASIVPEGAIARGKALLMEALKHGAVSCSGSASPDGPMVQIETVEWARPHAIKKRDGADCLTGPKLPWPIRYFDLFLNARGIFDLWPIVDYASRGADLKATDRTGAPGRPSSIHLVELMLRQRAERGELLPRVSEEADELSRLFNARDDYKLLARLSAKTIKNNLAALYRQLKAATEA